MFERLIKWLRSRPPIEPIEEKEPDDYEPFDETVVIPFRDEIDLHSIPPDLVRSVVEGYLEEARENGASFVRIIHGKGIGQQRALVRSILSKKSFVLHFRDADPESGGWGATVATLKPEP